MVIKKRKAPHKGLFVVACCFGCGALVNRGERNYVSLLWGDGDPGRDEMVVSRRKTIVRMCGRCRLQLLETTMLVVMLGELEIRLALYVTNEKSKTRADGVTPVHAVRRFV